MLRPNQPLGRRPPVPTSVRSVGVKSDTPLCRSRGGAPSVGVIWIWRRLVSRFFWTIFSFWIHPLDRITTLDTLLDITIGSSSPPNAARPLFWFKTFTRFPLAWTALGMSRNPVYLLSVRSLARRSTMRSPPKKQLRLVNQQLRTTKNVSPIRHWSLRPSLADLVSQLLKLLQVKPSKHQRRPASPPTKPHRRPRESDSLQRRNLQKPRRRQPRDLTNAQPCPLLSQSPKKSRRQSLTGRQPPSPKNAKTHHPVHQSQQRRPKRSPQSLQLRQLESPEHAKPHPLAHRTSPQATTEIPNSSMAS